MKAFLKHIAAVTTLSLSANAHSGESVFGWLYTLDLQPTGTFELEQKLDFTTGQAGGTYNLWKSKTGLEYGMSENLQLTGYLNSYAVQANKNYTNCEPGLRRCTAGFPVPGAYANDSFSQAAVDGGSVEFIWRLTNPVTSPLGVGLYLEPTLGKTRDALEARLLLQANFIDDRLVFAANVIAETATLKFDPSETIRESTLDLRYGVSYRFQPNWFAGVEGRFHNDFDGNSFGTQTQRANFIGPNLHYANKDWWLTAAWLYQLGGTCMAPGDAECANGQVLDSHGRHQFIVKVGLPFN